MKERVFSIKKLAGMFSKNSDKSDGLEKDITEMTILNIVQDTPKFKREYFDSDCFTISFERPPEKYCPKRKCSNVCRNRTTSASS